MSVACYCKWITETSETTAQNVMRFFNITCSLSPRFLLVEIHKKVSIIFHEFRKAVYVQLKGSKDDQICCKSTDQLF